MTIYVYLARTIQRVDGDEVEAVAEALLEAVREDPVLKHASVAVVPGAPFTCFDVRAEVSANGRDQLAVGCAFATADESWKMALENVGLVGSVARSQMSI